MTTATYPGIDAAELQGLLSTGSPIELIDVRSPAEFESAHIPGSLNIPLETLRKAAPRLHSQINAPVVLVCQQGPRAVQAAGHLRAAGVADARVLEGGLGRWDDGARDVERGAQRWALERQVRLVAGSLVLTGIALSLVKPKAKFFSAAIGGGLTFSALSNTCAMGNVLSRLPYNRTAAYDPEAVLARVGSR